MPERRAIRHDMINAATDEYTISKICYLYSKQWIGDTLVVIKSIQHETRVNNGRNISRHNMSETVTPSAAACINNAPASLQSMKKETVSSSSCRVVARRPANGGKWRRAYEREVFKCRISDSVANLGLGKTSPSWIYPI
ncbi:hypothetical protein V6N13_145599 [Hibiscus sabdariffa]|uniref:Uncharacterized protein n=1 Tax=Hibiscus sabdariffa TaxID=183260 RepID=A0ABR2TQ30_9ROSI